MLQILCNTSGFHARKNRLVGYSAATGYDQNNLIAGPRSKRFKTTAATGGTIGYLHDQILLQCTHMVIARADWLLTDNGSGNYGTDIRGYYFDTPGAASFVNVFGSTILDDPTDLIGYRGQDYVKSFTGASGYGWAATMYGNPATATSSTIQMSKLYFADAFDFGVNPKHSGITWDYMSESQSNLFRPLEGTFDYACEARITIDLPEIAPDALDDFAALPDIYRAPFFLYDADAEVIPWKLEHVILERFEQRLIAADAWSASLSFLRLKHYA